MKKKGKIIIGAVSALLAIAILIPVSYYFIFTETIVLDSMPAPDIQEQIDIYAELGYCISGHSDGENIEIRLTRQQRQKWIKDVQEEVDFLLDEANDLNDMNFEASGDFKELILIANENMSFNSMTPYLLGLTYDMQLFQVLNGEDNWGICFTLKDMDTNEVLYIADFPEENIKFNEEIWD